MERKLLRALYDCFYTRPRFDEQENEVEECHKALIAAFGKSRNENWCCGLSTPKNISQNRPPSTVLWLALNGVEALNRTAK